MLMEPLGDADMVRGSALPQKRQAVRIYTSSYFLIVLGFLSVDKNITNFLLLSACHVFCTIMDARPL